MTFRTFNMQHASTRAGFTKVVPVMGRNARTLVDHAIAFSITIDFNPFRAHPRAAHSRTVKAGTGNHTPGAGIRRTETSA